MARPRHPSHLALVPILLLSTYRTLLAAPLPASATVSTPWTPSSLPNPTSSSAACTRPSPGFLCDPDALLPPSSSDFIAGTLQQIRDGTPPYAVIPCGAAGARGVQVGVAVVAKVASVGERASEEEVMRFTKGVHDAWGVGDKECNNGVVFVLSIRDRRMYISTGAGVKNRLTESRIEEIFDVIKPVLRDGKVGPAVEMGVVAIGKVIAGYGVKGFLQRVGEYAVPLAFVAVFVGIIVVGKMAERKKKKQYAECSSKLSALEKDRAAALANQYQATSCPICFEEWTPAPSSDTSKTLKPPKSDDLVQRKVTGGQSPTATTLLRCGHKFCTACIDQWLRNSAARTCPVCRQDVTGAPEPPPTAPDTSSWAFYEPEMRFRAHRLHEMYPHYITSSALSTWENERYRGSLVSCAEFVSVSPDVRADAMRRGSGGWSVGGGSSSFGGGSSSGGGGGGGSW